MGSVKLKACTYEMAPYVSCLVVEPEKRTHCLFCAVVGLQERRSEVSPALLLMHKTCSGQKAQVSVTHPIVFRDVLVVSQSVWKCVEVQQVLQVMALGSAFSGWHIDG